MLKTCHSINKEPHLFWSAALFCALCTRIPSMDKEDLKDSIKVPFLGFAAVLSSLFVFLLLLYIIAIAVCFLAALG